MLATAAIENLFIKISNAYAEDRDGQHSIWAKLSDIKRLAGLTQDEMMQVALWMLDEVEDFRCEPEPFMHRVTGDAEYAAGALHIGGEDRHLMAFMED